MNLKVLENVKNLNVEENDLVELISNSYNFYLNYSNIKLSENLKNDLIKQKVFSNFVRFFRSLNSNKKFEDEVFQNFLKEGFKGKTKFISTLSDKVQEIIAVQTNRIYFSDRGNLNYLSSGNADNENSKPFSDLMNNLSNNYHLIKNLSFKILVTISNNISNRVLVPEIFLYITLENGRTVEMFVDLKTFQELRKCLAFHIKKMIDNEAVNLLK